MTMLKDRERKMVQGWFEKLRDPVRLVVFTQEAECEYCTQTRELAAEVASLSDKLTVEVYDLVANADRAKEYGVDKIPAIALVGGKDYGVRFYGFPGGYEFTSLVESIIGVSTGEHGLSEVTLQALAGLTGPVHLEVFVTPT